MWDLVITGGTLVDGTGAVPRRADLGIRDGRITAIVDAGGPSAPADPPTAHHDRRPDHDHDRRPDHDDRRPEHDDLDGRGGPAGLTGLTGAAADRLDATGRLVLPGFVDAHSHGDALVLDPDLQRACLRQGVTTVVLGQDGVSFAPADPVTMAWATRYFGSINGRHPGLGEGPVSVADLRATWHRRTALNTAYLVPHATVRHHVLRDADRGPDSDELSAMRALVERGLAEGAVGLSSGLEYTPARYAATAELAALCEPLRAAGLPYVTHLRGYGTAAPAALVEAVTIARTAGVALHVSHLHGPPVPILSLVDGARATGVDVTFDTYPYRRGCTLLAMAVGASGADPARWPGIRFAHVPAPEWAWVEGLALVDAAARSGRDPGALLADVIAATGGAATGILVQPASSDATVRALAGHVGHVGGSDGIGIGGHPHPRAYGAFARLLTLFVRRYGDWSWADAAEHLAARPAARFGLRDRGILTLGAPADLCLVDPATVTDHATYAAPRTLATGIDDVVVNGTVVLRDGVPTGAPAGVALTPGGSR